MSQSYTGTTGNDRLVAGNNTASSAYYTEIYSDWIIAGYDGDDYLEAEYGDDTMSGNVGNDTIYSGPGSDFISGGKGNDLINGENDGDTIYGNLGIDTIFGGSGDDYMRGGWGNDLLDGGVGDDTIYGMDEADTLSGGSGNDTFAYTMNIHSTYKSMDTITDFEVSYDKIDLTPITCITSNITNTAQSLVNNSDGLLKNLNTLAYYNTIDSGLLNFTYQNDTYVYIEKSGAESNYNENDMVIKVTGTNSGFSIGNNIVYTASVTVNSPPQLSVIASQPITIYNYVDESGAENYTPLKLSSLVKATDSNADAITNYRIKDDTEYCGFFAKGTTDYSSDQLGTGWIEFNNLDSITLYPSNLISLARYKTDHTLTNTYKVQAFDSKEWGDILFLNVNTKLEWASSGETIFTVTKPMSPSTSI